MKRCGDCGRDYPTETLACLDCNELLESGPYVRFVFAAFTVSSAIVWLLARMKLLESFSWTEPFVYVAFACLTIYPLTKLIQKLRDPTRPVLGEMGSVYTERFERVLVLCLILLPIAAVFDLSIVRMFHRVPVDPSFVPIRRVILWTVTIGGPLAAIAMIVDQGWAFFDPRVKNTYLSRIRDSL